MCGLSGEKETSRRLRRGVDGVVIDITTMPWMVSLGHWKHRDHRPAWGHQCVGTIIGPHSILTAAHCKSFM